MHVSINDRRCSNLFRAILWTKFGQNKREEKKSGSIAYFNSVNNAVAIATTYADDATDASMMKEKIVYWRDWLISEYDNYKNGEEKDPF